MKEIGLFQRTACQPYPEFSNVTTRDFNPRPAMGDILPLSRIFAITWQIRKISPLNFQYLIGHQFDTMSDLKKIEIGVL